MPGQHLCHLEIFKILMVSDNINAMLGTFEVMVPDLEAFEDGQ